ncbi:MAG: sigma-70 family RNA polymerase sigma factor [Anaerolineae bacterium]|nr:sigma-70 family RNA polymerase sigma factor [Anaerolineae bacterium]
MLLPDHSALIALCLRILQQLCGEEPELGLSAEQLPGLAHRIASRLSDNLTSGRFSYVCTQGYLAGSDEERLFHYAVNVCRLYLQEGNLIASLEAGEEATWQRVLDRFVRLAYNKYLGKGDRDWAVQEAHILASETASELWRYLQSHPYPFDVPFDQWSACLLNRRFLDWCRVQQRETLRLVPDEPIKPDDTEGPTRLSLVAEKPLTQWQENYANRELLLEAIGRLRNPLEQQAIRLYYLKELAIQEVADELGITENYVYVLLHRARKRLRQALENDERFRC